MNKYTIIGITIFLILAFASTQPIREDQSCLSQYQSWYYSGQQCMQCYNYFQDSVETCNKCSGDQCSGCDGTTVLVKEKMQKMNQQGKFVDVELSYCRQCFNLDQNKEKIVNNVEECCFMDQKEKIQLNTENIDQNDSEFGTYTYGYGSYKSTGYHATKCTPQDNGQDIKLYGSVCYTIENCQKIGDYGHCMQCLDGFYLANDLSCTKCDNHDWYDPENSELKSPTVNVVDSTGPNTDGFCKKCNGPAQCSECGIGTYTTNTNGVSEEFVSGSFLSTNQGREFYDLNISKNPSFCRKCNVNCLCTDSTELCKTCIDGTATTPGTEGAYYYDPHTQQCKHCSEIGNNDEDQLCNKCMWVTELDRAVCLGCQDRTDGSATKAHQGYGQKLKEFNSDNSYNVLAFPLTYYKRTDEDHKIEEVSGKEKQCIPCYKIFQTPANGITNKRQEVIWENENTSDPKDSLSYKIKNLAKTKGEYEVNGQKESQIVYFDHSATNTEPYTGQQSDEFKRGGCANCSLVSVNGQYKENTSDTSTITSDRKQDVVFYVTCNQCHNGFAEVVYNNFTFETKTDIGTKTDVTMEFNIQNYKKCHTCQYLMKLHDKKLVEYKSEGNDEIVSNDNMRYQSTSRCQRLEKSSTLKSFFNYKLTQCSSESVEDYLTPSTTDESKYNRGTGYLNYLDSDDDDEKNKITQRANIDYYFTDAVNKLGKFRVNVSQSGTSKFKRMQNLCVSNKNQCKQIIEISKDTGSRQTEDKVSEYSPLDSPRCSQCFDTYVLTQDYTCVKCPSDYRAVGSSGNNNSNITYGCNSCVAETLTDNKFSKIVLCNGCYNNVQPTYQVKQDLRNNVTYQENIDRKNYYFNEDKKTCTECNVGCLECQNEQKKCEKSQNYYRIAENFGKDNTTFERCTVDYCLNCDNGKDVCQRCEAGYAVIKLNSDEDNKFIYRCEKCEKGCLKCESDVYDNATSSQYQESTYNRKNCSACEIGYYLEKNNDKGVCKPARDNCINWLSEGGACLQCAFGYRLQDGWCYKCIDSYSGLLGNGYWDCPSQCDSETGITSSSSNVRNAAALKANAELTASKNPVDEPETPEETTPETTSRILQLLDEFQPSN